MNKILTKLENKMDVHFNSCKDIHGQEYTYLHGKLLHIPCKHMGEPKLEVPIIPNPGIKN